MAVSKKGKRKITVGDKTYMWRVINIHDENHCPIAKRLEVIYEPTRTKIVEHVHHASITPRFVRNVIVQRFGE